MDPPFKHRHFELASLPWSELWLNGGPIQKFKAIGPTDADGIPMYRWGDKFYYHPVKIELQGLFRLDSYVRTGDARYLPTLRKFDAKLRSMALDSDNGSWFLPDSFDLTTEGMPAPWFNSMSQGLGLSFFSRMYRLFGNPVDLAAATRLFRSFEVRGPRRGPWVSQLEHGEVWLEHYPDGINLHVLNAHMHALFGLYDYWQEVRTPEARHVLEAAITTMRDNVDRFRRPGGISVYCLIHPIISMKYHHLHVKQLKQLARVSGDDYFSEEAKLFRQDAW